VGLRSDKATVRSSHTMATRGPRRVQIRLERTGPAGVNPGNVGKNAATRETAVGCTDRSDQATVKAAGAHLRQKGNAGYL